MKKITLSAMAMLALSGAAAAGTLTLYTDAATGQVYTTPGEGRAEMGDFVDAKTVYEENQAQDSAIVKKDVKAAKKGKTPVYSKASKLKFSGKHYLGYRYRDQKDSSIDNQSQFETRRNYFQVKAYMFDNPKSYMRITMDTYQNNNISWKYDSVDDNNEQAEKQGDSDYGSYDVRLKYAFLYLDNILPYTGVELGMVHRPWHDYEQKSGYLFRSIAKVFMEAKESADLSNSADLGINFKTKTPYLQTELGVFNGEGYHQQEMGQGNSFEWRVTGVLTGNGDKKTKPKKTTYAHISSFGQIQEESNKVGTRDSDVADGYDFNIYGFHGVYNQPEFLIAAQYIKSESDAPNDYKQGDGYSINGTYRFGGDKEYGIFGRYDRWDDDKKDYEKEYWLAGAYYDYNKNVRFIANAISTDKDKTDDVAANKYMDYMFTAEVNW
ncbi:MAG: hypothetical protein U9Q62_03000 [Campylobacterota bacterium]|nr:hypothetical protein [Campylobacterota bacterium]